MPRYQFAFRREYTITEGFDRTIEAPSLEEAKAAASNLASEFNMDCPDDCSEDERGHTETGDFDAEPAEHTPQGDPDYYITTDGQCLPWEEE